MILTYYRILYLLFITGFITNMFWIDDDDNIVVVVKEAIKGSRNFVFMSDFPTQQKSQSIYSPQSLAMRKIQHLRRLPCDWNRIFYMHTVRRFACFLNLPWKYSTHTWSEVGVASTWKICFLLPKVKVLNCDTLEVSTTLLNLPIFYFNSS